MAASPDSNHPDLLALDALRAGEGSPGDQAHVASCGICRGALDQLERAAEDLRSHARREVEVPLEVDRAILAWAGKELESLQGRNRHRSRRWIAAAAAACILAALIVLTALPDSRALDIVDAYQLALRIRTGVLADPSWDRNHDGVVDQKDVDGIARESVSLARRQR